MTCSSQEKVLEKLDEACHFAIAWSDGRFETIPIIQEALSGIPSLTTTFHTCS